ncbi:hypothetical protein [Flavobacterium sp.]
MLQLQDYYGVSEEIDVLKGVNKYPDTFKQAMEIAKRKIMSNRDKKDSGN